MMEHRAPLRHRKRKCLNCKDRFIADYRNLTRQHYCSKPECRAASKKASQRKYIASEKGCEYFHGEPNVTRVREWRESHPGYWRRKADLSQTALQDDCSSQPLLNQADTCKLNFGALQDICFTQPALFIGLISSLTGNTLQDNIAETTKRFIDLGYDILGFIPQPHAKGGRRDDRKAHYLSTTPAPRSKAIQLGRSAPGP